MARRKRRIEKITKIQEENKQSYNKKIKKATKYQLGDLVVFRRTQFGTELMIFPKFIGQYWVTQVYPQDRYEFDRAAPGEGPGKTTTSSDNIKHWCQPASEEVDDDGDADSTSPSETEDEQEGRVVQKYPLPATVIEQRADVTKHQANKEVFVL